MKRETKHTAHNLKFIDHPTFIDQFVIVDAQGDPFIWINKHTGAASFGGKYFILFKEQLLVEVIGRFITMSEQLKDSLSDAVSQAEIALNLSDVEHSTQPRGEAAK
jgi:hypothetical protein